MRASGKPRRNAIRQAASRSVERRACPRSDRDSPLPTFARQGTTFARARAVSGSVSSIGPVRRTFIRRASSVQNSSKPYGKSDCGGIPLPRLARKIQHDTHYLDLNVRKSCCCRRRWTTTLARIIRCGSLTPLSMKRTFQRRVCPGRGEGDRPPRLPADLLKLYIPRSRQNPKILWVDDAEVVGDRITKACPVLGDFVAQEIERGVREMSACGVAFVVRDISVHEAP